MVSQYPFTPKPLTPNPLNEEAVVKELKQVFEGSSAQVIARGDQAWVVLYRGTPLMTVSKRQRQFTMALFHAMLMQ
jgi:hypothetical protein